MTTLIAMTPKKVRLMIMTTTKLVQLYEDEYSTTLSYNPTTGKFFFYYGPLSGAVYFNEFVEYTQYLFDNKEFIRRFFSTLNNILEQYVYEQSQCPDYS